TKTRRTRSQLFRRLSSCVRAFVAIVGKTTVIRVELPQHLRTLAHVDREVTVDVAGEPTLRAVIDAVEERYPMLRGTIRDHVTQQRRPFVRFYACSEDWSH